MQNSSQTFDLKDITAMKTNQKIQLADKDESQVWQLFLDGDDHSLVYIYRRYINVLFRYGQQFSRRDEFVQDCIQELFCDLLDKRNRLSPARSIKGYLFASLKRKIINGIKKEEKIQFEEEGFRFIKAETAHPISHNLKEQDFEIIYQKINDLPSSQRETIFLYFYEGLSYADIAEIMNVKVATARTLTYRALENLEKHLGPYMSSFYVLCLIYHHNSTCI